MPSQVQPPALITRQLFRPGVGPCGDVLVVVLLRGGMDGIHVFPPHADPEYYRQRRRLAPMPPGRAGGTVDLDGFFGLHPVMSPLTDAFRAGQLAVVQACGSPDQTLSHFAAAQAMERGVADAGSAGSGWLSRHFATHETANSSVLRAVSFSNVLPSILEGSRDVKVLRRLSDLRLHVPSSWAESYRPMLAELYASGNDPASVAGRQILDLMRDLGRLRLEQYQPAGSASYPNDSFGRSFVQVAQLIKAEVGLEAAVVQLGGWDTHVQQLGGIDGPMRTLAQSLAAFTLDLGDLMRQVVVVALSEFGRRVGENSGLGTDHGRAGAMLVLGGHVRGGRVYGRWPGLAPGQTDRDGNLQVTTDYRDVLAELVERRLKNRNVPTVFPGFSPTVPHLFL